MNHGEGNYEASYVVTRAGEYQMVRSMCPVLHDKLVDQQDALLH